MPPASSKHSFKNCHSRTEKRTCSPCLLKELHWLPVKKQRIIRLCPWHTNATKVWCQNTFRNSFRSIFLHDPFAHHLKYALRFQLLRKTHKKTVWFQSFLQLCPKAVECSTTKKSGKQISLRRSADVEKLAYIVHRNFSVFPRLFSMVLLTFLLKIISFSVLSIQVNGTKR